MAPQSPQLVMRTGPHPGKAYPLEKDEISIGRDINNDVIINDAEVSRHHARITRQAGTYLLEDLGSTNGTFVNGERLSGARSLRPGETITFGENVSLAFEAAPYDADATLVGGMPAPSPQAQIPPARPPEEAYAPPPRQAYAPPPQPQPYAQPDRPPEPMYSGQIPPGPAEAFPPAEEAARPRRNWIVASCILVAILLCLVVVAALWYIDANFLWCRFFPFIPGC